MLNESICHFRSVVSILSLYLFLIEHRANKHCGPWSDATLCGVWSGSALFPYDPFTGFQERMSLRQMRKVILVKVFDAAATVKTVRPLLS